MLELIGLVLFVGAFYVLGYRQVRVRAILAYFGLLVLLPFWQQGVNGFVLLASVLPVVFYVYGAKRRVQQDYATRRAQKDVRARADYLNVIFAQANDPSAEHVVAIVTHPKEV